MRTINGTSRLRDGVLFKRRELRKGEALPAAVAQEDADESITRNDA